MVNTQCLTEKEKLLKQLLKWIYYSSPQLRSWINESHSYNYNRFNGFKNYIKHQILSTFKYFLVVLFISQNFFFAQYRAFSPEEKPAQEDTVITQDTFKVELRLPPQNILDKYKNDKVFDYSPNPGTTESLWDKIINWINRQLFGLQTSKTYSDIIDYLLYGLMIAALIVIIIGLFKSEIRGFFYGAQKEQKVQFAEQEEDIHKINIDELIAQAVEQKEYKIAVRYIFLKTLKLLSDKKIIDLQSNKTNLDYFSEIKRSEVANLFSQAALGFEVAWYGDFPVDEGRYKYSKNVFNNLYEKIREE